MTNHNDDNPSLPKEWEDAHPVLESWYGEVRGFRSELDSRTAERNAAFATLREHFDIRMDQVEISLKDAADTQKYHATLIEETRRETRRLHDQQTSLLEANRAILSGFGQSLGQLSERQHQFSVLTALQLLASAIGFVVLIYLSLHLR